MSSPAFAPRSPIITFAPARRNASDIARPIPRAPPVTNTTLPCMSLPPHAERPAQPPCAGMRGRRNLGRRDAQYTAMNSGADAILTYDLGTTRIKVALFDLRGRLIGQRASRHQEQRAEQPRVAGRRRLVDRRRTSDARTAGGQTAPRRRDLRLWPRRRRGVHRPRRHRHRPAVVGPPACRGTQRADGVAQGSGAHLSNYAAALLAKKQWFAANEPTRARQLRHVLYAKDFLIYRLTGQAVTDCTSGPDAAQLGRARARPHRLRKPRSAPGAAVGRRGTARSDRRDGARPRARHPGRRRRARRHLRERRRRRGLSRRVRDHARHARGRAHDPHRRSERRVPLLRPAARAATSSAATR